MNYLSVIPGQTGIPLSYIVRNQHLPTYQPYPTYHLQLINQAPLSGRVYLADTSSVYQILCSLTTSTPAEEWIKASNPRSDGRTAFHALVNHYNGSGFASRQIAEAAQLDKTLHYKNERAIQFSTFTLKL